MLEAEEHSLFLGKENRIKLLSSFSSCHEVVLYLRENKQKIHVKT